MGIHARNAGERLRTVWTPEMDRFFIDLMLAELQKGSKFEDHMFSKRTWKNMASTFNDKFEFQYEKDVLKNRHKTLRNLYRAVKTLLGRRGFVWDENRKMVTAENSIWDEYIKAHPEARSLRIKSIPYYDDLCLIYKDTVPETKPEEEEEPSVSCEAEPSRDPGQMLALHDILVDGDYGFGPIEKEPETEPAPSSSGAGFAGRTRTYWQPPMDRYFIDLMLDHVRRGSRRDGVFRKQAWTEMIAMFNAKFGFSYDVEVLKNRFKTLKRQYNVIRNLLGLPGFVWDETRQMVTADDRVWQDYIKAHSDARQFMTRPIPYYKDLRTICDPNSDEAECSSGQETAESPAKNNKRRLEDFSGVSDLKRARDGDGMVVALREMATAVSSLSEKSSVSIESVVEAVQALPDMDEELVLDSCDFLEDEKKAKTFMALDPKLRKKWLLRKLR